MGITSFLKLVEIQTKVASVIPYMVGTAFVLYKFDNFNIKNAILLFLSMIIFDMTVTAINNYVDYIKAIKKEVKAQNCKRAILVGHNAHFDQSFINAAALRNKLDKKNPFHPFSVLDTASLSALVYGQTVLARSCKAAGLNFDEKFAHGAAYDTKMECDLFCSILNRFTIFQGFPPIKALEE